MERDGNILVKCTHYHEMFGVCGNMLSGNKTDPGGNGYRNHDYVNGLVTLRARGRHMVFVRKK